MDLWELGGKEISLHSNNITKLEELRGMEGKMRMREHLRFWRILEIQCNAQMQKNEMSVGEEVTTCIQTTTRQEMIMKLFIFFFFFWSKAWSIYWNGIINTETTGLILKNHDWRRSVKLYLDTIFLSANRLRSWNLCITLVLQGLAFLHDQQEVVGREPPGGPAPLRGLVMSPLLPYCLATEYGKNIS